jgi:hypothetical protein
VTATDPNVRCTIYLCACAVLSVVALVAGIAAMLAVAVFMILAAGRLHP